MSSRNHSIAPGKLIARMQILAWRMPVLFAIAVISTLGIVTAASASLLYTPAITATKTDAFIGGDGDGKADPSETIEYTVAINNSVTDATGVTFDDTIDANTSLVGGSVAASPVGINDT